MKKNLASLVKVLGVVFFIVSPFLTHFILVNSNRKYGALANALPGGAADAARSTYPSKSGPRAPYCCSSLSLGSGM